MNVKFLLFIVALFMKAPIFGFAIFSSQYMFSVYFPYEKDLSPETFQTIQDIDFYINKYKHPGENVFLYLACFRNKPWAVNYRAKIAEIDSLTKDSLRYPDVYQNILLFDQRIDVLSKYWYESAYQDYMSLVYTEDEKTQAIAKQRSRCNDATQHCKQVLYDCRDKIIDAYRIVFEILIERKEVDLLTYHDYGLLSFMNNDCDKSLELLLALIDHAQKTHQIEKIGAKVYHDLGSVCVEVMAYDKAIKYLSEAIRLDPHNKETYFNRAVAYFETGLSKLQST